MHNTYPSQHEQAILLDTDLQPWHDRMEELIENDTRIIAFRGAGSANGIEPAAADAIGEMLHRYITEVTETGTPVAILYDGDNDVRDRPDLGSVFGTLADSLTDNPNVTAIAVQTKQWYKPKAEGMALASAGDNAYETYVFDRDMSAIDPSLKDRGMAHSALTQSEALALYPNYEQIIVGAAGPITAAQLHDLAGKAKHRAQTDGPVPVTVLAAPINPALDEQIRYTAQNDPNETRRARAEQKVIQRQDYPYGFLCSKDGELCLDEAEYPGVSFQLYTFDQ